MRMIKFVTSEFGDTNVQIKKSSAEFLAKKNTTFIEHFQNRHTYPELSAVSWKTVESFVGFEVFSPFQNLAQCSYAYKWCLYQ